MPPPLIPNKYVPTPAPGKPIDERPPLAEDLAKRIRASLAKLSPQQNTATRSVIDLYYSLITTKPYMAADGDSQFPRNPKFHPINTERFVMKEVNKSNLLIHHLGAAILGMYRVANLIQEATTIKNDGQAKVAWNAAKVEFDKVQPRVYLLENVARYGLDGFAVEGDETEGYTLYRPPVVVNPVVPIIDTNIKAADLRRVAEEAEEEQII